MNMKQMTHAWLRQYHLRNLFREAAQKGIPTDELFSSIVEKYLSNIHQKGSIKAELFRDTESLRCKMFQIPTVLKGKLTSIATEFETTAGTLVRCAMESHYGPEPEFVLPSLIQPKPNN